MLWKKCGGAGEVSPSFRICGTPKNWLNLGVKTQEHMETNEKWGYKRELVFSSWFSCYHSHLASKTPQDGSPHKNALGPEG